MKLVNRFSLSGIPSDSDPFEDMASGSRQAAMREFDSNKVAGLFDTDAEGKLVSWTNPRVRYVNSGNGKKVTSVIVNGSDTHLRPFKLTSKAALSWFPIVGERRDLARWAAKGEALTPAIMAAVDFNANGLDQPGAALVPMVAAFTYRKERIHKASILDPEVVDHLGRVYGSDVQAWGAYKALALEDDKWKDFVALYEECERQGKVEKFFGTRVKNDKLEVWKGEPSCVPVMIDEEHEEADYNIMKDTLGAFESAASTAGGALPAPGAGGGLSSPTQLEIITPDMKKEQAELSLGERAITGLLMRGNYNEDTGKIENFSFPVLTSKYLEVMSTTTTKSERTELMKRLLDAANALRTKATRYNNLVKLRCMPDHDASLVTGLLTGCISKVPIKEIEEVSTDLSVLHWLRFGKEYLKALRAQRSQHRWALNNGGESEKSLKRKGLSNAHISEMKQVKELIANFVGDFAALALCDDEDNLPMLYSGMVKMFDFLEDDWESWEDEVGPMPLLPVAISLILDKFMSNIMAAGTSFQNDSAIRAKAIGSFDVDLYRKAYSSLHNSLRELKKYKENDKLWDNYPTFLKDMYEQAAKRTKGDDGSAIVAAGLSQSPSADRQQQGSQRKQGGGANGGTNNGGGTNANNGGKANNGGNTNTNGGGGGANNGKRNGRRVSGGSGYDKTKADPSTKGCFVLVGGNENFIALSPAVRAVYCPEFATVGKTCPGCDLKKSWFDKYEEKEKASQIYVEKHKAHVRFNANSYSVKRSLPQNKHHLIGSGEAK
jgi:hypothetical protein